MKEPTPSPQILPSVGPCSRSAYNRPRGRDGSWYRAGVNVQREMPKLTTYLGHVSVANTYWYIEAVPELLRLAAEYSCGLRGGAR